MRNTGTHKIMRRSLSILFLLWMLTWIGALPAQAVTYRPTRSVTCMQQPEQGIYLTTTGSHEIDKNKTFGHLSAPVAGFQTTSAFMRHLDNSGGSSSSIINTDGSVAEGFYLTGGGPRKTGPGTPDPNPDPGTQQALPVGDALLPLLLMAIAYILFQRRKNEKTLLQ